MIRALVVLLALWPAAAPAQELSRDFGPDTAPETLLLRSTTDLAVLGPVVEAFLDTRPGLRVAFEQWGSNPLYRLQSEDCAAGRAGADLVISSAVHQMVDLVNEGCARPYRSALTAALPDALSWRDELWGVTREPAVMVYNRERVAPAQVPRSRFDLLDLLRPTESPFRGRVATYDIERSGLGFLFAFADSMEASTFGGLMESFGRSGAVATCCSAEIIDGVAEGRYLVAYNVLGSYALARARRDERLGVVAPEDYTLMLSRAAMIPRVAGNPRAAAQFVDFLLSPEGRQALEAALLIVRLEAEDGAALDRTAETPERPIPLSPALLIALDAHKRALFGARWRDAFPAAGGTAP
ncbi:ABC transporter substrate-binding protein [Limimaricola pyoseonensis]|uniref:Iron(III) transport system substrate-binding protein n=1 Tax=Limimaricola pyoseonensis TaxID=521013 RepID=A0A1G7CN93_9RHOB|nr:ABC transporter substrate-binding protein [Limimaricola pyoseonensis]SDE40240.1 iron(III) transport system substrate-binding protein [Limimaricola pyoseonensis]